MPCVLPVLSLKVMGFVSHGGAARGESGGEVVTLVDKKGRG